MSVAETVAVIAGILLFLALIAAMFGSGKKRLGPVNANLAPGNPPAPGLITIRTIDRLLLIKGSVILVVVAVAAVFLWTYSAAILALIKGTGTGLSTASWMNLVTVALVPLAIAYTFRNFAFPDILVRALKGAAAVLLWLAIGVPALTAILPCSSTDTACLHQQAVKEEQQRQKQAAAQRAIEASRQPVAPQCNVQRRPHRYPASKPAVSDNPGGVCAVALFIKGHCVYYTQNNNDQPAGMICVNNNNEQAVRDMRGNPIDMPEDVDRVWSTSAAFDGSIGLWQPRYTKLLSWR